MTFIPMASPVQEIEPAPILVLNDHPTVRALTDRQRMDTADRGILEEALHRSGMVKNDVTFANVFPTQTTLTGLWHAKGKYFTPEAKVYVGAINEVIAQHRAKVIVPLGACATAALLGRSDYTSIRGYPFPYGDRVVIPSLHPRDMVWSNYIWRFYLAHDLHKAKRFATGEAKIQEPNLVICDSVSLVESLARLLSQSNLFAMDIEVTNYEVSCISFARDCDNGFTVPFDMRWTEDEELHIWNLVAGPLENPNISKVLQNGIFDKYFLWYKNQILVQGMIEDTMVSHSVVYPDFLKGLGFLASIHTNLTYWKDEADFREGFKEEA